MSNVAMTIHEQITVQTDVFISLGMYLEADRHFSISTELEPTEPFFCVCMYVCVFKHMIKKYRLNNSCESKTVYIQAPDFKAGIDLSSFIYKTGEVNQLNPMDSLSMKTLLFQNLIKFSPTQALINKTHFYFPRYFEVLCNIGQIGQLKISSEREIIIVQKLELRGSVGQ